MAYQQLHSDGRKGEIAAEHCLHYFADYLAIESLWGVGALGFGKDLATNSPIFGYI